MRLKTKYLFLYHSLKLEQNRNTVSIAFIRVKGIYKLINKEAHTTEVYVNFYIKHGREAIPLEGYPWWYIAGTVLFTWVKSCDM